ncbi:uncharacterized protein LACBIDRAFT_321408 [Laccaria bicolor S238N-H82]|uniref:Predicted protein n=1 Tax=Laccaria bicolor (strain S238N-H82 / ATCC MYA-4686) TaxID=486041 RepID=B0CQ97_LACBS|nr:uncharacterized protein LACBIDRAFT_321408 [Laccaria bicolor S238N-H82]EDR15517.1 predicted protein [Laccaria bicolor S238N-H82]|eukprot:XP_001873725.1 predicted protein [Laccaria bicolor S238N-H82]
MAYRDPTDTNTKDSSQDWVGLFFTARVEPLRANGREGETSRHWRDYVCYEELRRKRGAGMAMRALGFPLAFTPPGVDGSRVCKAIIQAITAVHRQVVVIEIYNKVCVISILVPKRKRVGNEMEKGLVNATYTLRPTRQLEQALSLVVGRAGVRGWYGEQREEQTEAISRSNKRGDKTLIVGRKRSDGGWVRGLITASQAMMLESIMELHRRLSTSLKLSEFWETLVQRLAVLSRVTKAMVGVVDVLLVSSSSASQPQKSEEVGLA